MSALLDTARVTRAMLAASPVRRRKPSRSRLPWSPDENATLTREWGEVCPRVLRKLLPGRSWIAILVHAKDVLRLDMGLPQETVSLTEAAHLCGYYSAKTVRKLAERHGIAVRLHPRPLSTGAKKSPRRCVDRVAILDACAAETRDTETVRAAARARGIKDVTLWRWLRDAGVIAAPVPGEKSRGFLRVSSTEIDRVVKEHRAAQSARAPRAT